MKSDALSELDIMAYVDGELDLANRLQVEDLLARNPPLSARVMSEFRARTALKLLSANNPPIPAEMARFTRRMLAEPKSRWQRRWTRAGLAAGVVGLMATALFALAQPASPPSYVFDAVASHRTAMLRAAMVSQLETPNFDAGEILSKTDISIPSLPADWRVTDVQLFPFGRESAVIIAIETPSGEYRSIFAVRELTTAPEEPAAVRDGGESVAFWRRGNVSYALTGDDEPHDLDASAEALAQLWNS